MKLYVCHGTFLHAPRPGGHPCGQAYKALREAGYDPEVEKVRGWDKLPDVIANRTPGRRKVKELTGSVTVPVLVMDDGTAMPESRDIIAWAKANPAPASA